MEQSAAIADGPSLLLAHFAIRSWKALLVLWRAGIGYVRSVRNAVTVAAFAAVVSGTRRALEQIEALATKETE